MAKQPLGTNFVREYMAQAKDETGKTRWDSLVETLRSETAKGRRGFATLLRRAEAFQANHPEMTREGGSKPEDAGHV